MKALTITSVVACVALILLGATFFRYEPLGERAGGLVFVWDRLWGQTCVTTATPGKGVACTWDEFRALVHDKSREKPTHGDLERAAGERLTPRGKVILDDLREGGLSEEEVQRYKSKISKELLEDGLSMSDIFKYWGETDHGQREERVRSSDWWSGSGSVFSILGWIAAVPAALIAVIAFHLCRMGLRDRHFLGQFALTLLLEPVVYEAQRDNLLRLLQRASARDARELALQVALQLSKNASTIVGERGTVLNASVMWELHRGQRAP